jgi:hypothetical protein
MEKYEVLKDIGAGNFGVARLMRHKETKELVAMKYIPRGQKVPAVLPRRARVCFILRREIYACGVFFSCGSAD